MKFTDTVKIDAPIERVWEVTLDVEGLPDLSPTTMSRVERLEAGPLSVGSRTRIKQPGQAARVWTVRRLDEPHQFMWDTRWGPLTMTAIHALAADGDGTHNTLSLEVSGPGSAVVGRLMGRTVGRVLATENAGFKRVSEAPAGG